MATDHDETHDSDTGNDSTQGNGSTTGSGDTERSDNTQGRIDRSAHRSCGSRTRADRIRGRRVGITCAIDERGSGCCGDRASSADRRAT